VLGSAVAGTAAAWLFSMGTASADTIPVEPSVIQPTVDALTAPGQTKPSQLPDYVQHMVDTMSVDTVLPKPPVPPTELGELVQNAVQQVATHLAPQAKRDLTDVSVPARLRMIAFGDHDAPPVVRPVDATPQTVPATTVVSRGQTTAHDFGRQPVSDSPRRAPPSDESPVLPALPPLPAPLAPPTAPVGACNSCGHGSDDDLGVPVSHIWPDSRMGMATSRALRMITQHVAPAMGEQPGVTPD
jgi:hypothetical protein